MKKTLRAVLGRWRAGLAMGAMALACGPVHEPLEQAGEPLEAHAAQPLPEPRPLALSGPDMAYGGGKYLVVWRDVRTGGIYGARVKPDGTLLDPEGLRLNPSDAPARGRPRIAYDGNQFMVVWEGADDDILGVRVRPDGTVVGSVFNLITSGEIAGPDDIACSPQACLVTFTVSSDEGSDIGALRVSPEGEVLDELVLFLSAPGTLTGESAVAWGKEEFLVVWTDARGGSSTPDVYGARVRPDGTRPDLGASFPIAAAPGAQRVPDVTWTGRRFLVVWEDSRGADRDIYGARVRRDGRVDDPEGLAISTAPGDQRFPSVAHHNWKSLVAWGDARSGQCRVWGARVTEEGEVWDGSGFRISPGDYERECRPAVAYGGERFLVAYNGASAETAPGEPHFILATRVQHDTTVQDSPALVLTRSSEAPASAR